MSTGVLLRSATIGELFILATCGSVLITCYSKSMSRYRLGRLLIWAGFGYVAALTVVAAAVALNAFKLVPVSPGLILTSTMLAPVSIGVLVVTISVVRTILRDNADGTWRQHAT